MTRKEVIERLAQMADLADDLGLADLSAEIDSLMTKLASATDVDVDEIAEPVYALRAAARARGAIHVVTAANGLIGNVGDWMNDWFEKKVYGGEAGQLVYKIDQSGYLNQLAKYLNSFSPFFYKQVNRKKMREFTDPLQKMLSQFWALAKKSGQKIPELMNIRSLLSQRGTTARTAKEYVDQLRSLMRQYVTPEFAKKIDNPARRRPLPPTPSKPAPRPPAAKMPAQAPLPTPTPVPAANVPSKLDQLLKNQKDTFDSFYFQGKPRLTESVVDAVRKNFHLLPYDLRHQTRDLIKYVQQQGAPAAMGKAALKVDDVYGARLRDLRRLMEDFFKDRVSEAQPFMDAMYADLRKDWDQEFQEVEPPAAPPGGAATPAPPPPAAPAATPTPPAAATPPAPAATPAPAAAPAKAPGDTEYVDDAYKKPRNRKNLGTLRLGGTGQTNPQANKGKGSSAI